VYAGAVLQFTVSADAGRGRWWSANAAVVKVDAGTGVAAAVGEGVTTLHYNGSKLSTYTTVSVVQVTDTHSATTHLGALEPNTHNCSLCRCKIH
jgi:hypothetical protein